MTSAPKTIPKLGASICLSLVVAASTLSTSSTVSAQEPSSKPQVEAEKQAHAREAYAAGVTALDHGQLDLAIENFRLAHSSLPHQNTVLAIATVQQKQGQPQEALATLEAFFPDPETRSKDVQARFESLRASLPATLVLTSDTPGWMVRIDGATEAATTPTKVKVTAGTHTVELVSAKGQRVKRQKEMRPGVAYSVHGSILNPKPIEDDGPNVAAWVFGGLTAAALGTGVGFGIAALNSKGEYEERPTDERYETTNRQALISDLAFAGAAVFAVGTIVSLVADSDDERQATSRGLDLRIEPAASAAAIGLTAKGSF